MNILKVFVPFVALLLLVGCANLPPIPPKAPTIVKVPVAIPVPPPPVFTPVALPTDDLKPSDKGNYAKIATAYADSLAILKKEVSTLAAELDAYRSKTPIKAFQKAPASVNSTAVKK